ncbi:MAG TPA: acyl-CoA dehydrogenase family protein [Acidimicrobiia bacterium]|jgi:alkylation response protein AidB-like acyl-CoA dehydrogenase|nr:acyl-CoA dehydrogenase family protein [Acidimicrobiia bacterium]
MDFAFSEEQEELAGLAARILEDRMDLQHLKERDRSDDWYDLDTWREFAKANLLGIALPESAGGLGLGFVDLCMVLREVGRNVAPLPFIPTLVSAALPIARYGTDAQQAILSKVVAGDVLLTAALVEYGSESETPATTATRDGDGWRLDGAKGSVPAAAAAELILVPAATDDGVALFLVPAGANGITFERQQVMNHEPLFELRLDGVRVGDDARLGTPEQGSEILAFTLNRTTVATCALVSGVADKALRLTAQYTTERKQFDRAIGTFQAVGQRMADCYIDNQAIELTMLQAATHLEEGLDDPLEVATAKFWAADGGNRIGHAALHIHGGVSIDLDFPIHRYFLWLKRYEFSLGSATPELLRIGKALADTPVAN